jgi:hypothetical protein
VAEGGSVSDGYLTMAQDAGYRGDEARQYAEALEQAEYDHWCEQQTAAQYEAMLQEQCGAEGHAYHGDEFDPDSVPPEHRDEVGRCYCGAKRYPAGGAA